MCVCLEFIYLCAKLYWKPSNSPISTSVRAQALEFKNLRQESCDTEIMKILIKFQYCAKKLSYKQRVVFSDSYIIKFYVMFGNAVPTLCAMKVIVTLPI